MEGAERAWTWVGFEEAVCMNGSSTGIGINLNPSSDRLLILLEGGGACFNWISCAGVANSDGYGESKFDRDASGVLGNGVFDREDDANPYADWNFVYVPYCTGDVHGGQNPEGEGDRMHVGYRNFSHFLSRIVPTFPEVEEVVLAGRSAGGLGTLVNYPQTADAFGCTPVHALNDAGGILPDEYMRPCLQQLVRGNWGLDAAVPAGCDACTNSEGGGLVNILPYMASHYPDRRFAFLSAMEDGTMRSFYGFGYSDGCDFPASMPGSEYTAGLEAARDLMSGYDNFRSFYVPGEQHTFTYQSLSRTSSEGTELGSWLGAMLDDDDDDEWRDLGP